MSQYLHRNCPKQDMTCHGSQCRRSLAQTRTYSRCEVKSNYRATGHTHLNLYRGVNKSASQCIVDPSRRHDRRLASHPAFSVLQMLNDASHWHDLEITEFIVEAVTLVNCVQEVTGSILGPGTTCPHWGLICWLFNNTDIIGEHATLIVKTMMYWKGYRIYIYMNIFV
jgi:hypothetical protein